MSDIGLWITQNFNNREIAESAWIALFLDLIAIKKDVHTSMVVKVGHRKEIYKKIG